MTNLIKFTANLKCKTIGLCGKDGGMLSKICDVSIIVPSQDTPRIQEIHILVGHTICHLIEQEFKC